MKPEEFNQYLWDKRGPVDSSVAEMESRLAPLSYAKTRTAIPVAKFESPARDRAVFRSAAAIGIAIIGVWIAAITIRPQGPSAGTAWDVTALSGEPRVGGTHVEHAGKLRVGEWLQTDASSQAKLKVANIGTVTIQPDTRVRLVQSGDNTHKLELAQGEIEAFIVAPPRLFFVDTPAAMAVDLGCKYRLSIDEDGSGTLEVTLGWVSLERDGRVSIVPSGASCRIDRRRGPGTPHYLDATPAFCDALLALDSNSDEQTELATLVSESRPRDAMTLWHLLPRVEGKVRSAVFEKLVSYSPLPSGVDRAQALAADEGSLRRWAQSMYWSPPSSAMPK